MNDEALRQVYKAVVIAKLLYIIRIAMVGGRYANAMAADKQRVNE